MEVGATTETVTTEAITTGGVAAMPTTTAEMAVGASMTVLETTIEMAIDASMMEIGATMGETMVGIMITIITANGIGSETETVDSTLVGGGAEDNSKQLTRKSDKTLTQQSS